MDVKIIWGDGLMIDEELLNDIRRSKNDGKEGKSKLVVQCNEILNTLKDFIMGMKNMETASAILSLKRWISTKGKNNKIKFKRGDIVEVDLGLGYGFEMSYLHPCIVLEDSNAGFCLLVPCSTGKFGKRNKYIVDAYTNDGFKSNTGVLIDSFRCVSKTRINKKVGTVSLDFYDKVNDAILKEYFKKQVLKYENLKKDYSILVQENIMLKEKINDYKN